MSLPQEAFASWCAGSLTPALITELPGLCQDLDTQVVHCLIQGSSPAWTGEPPGCFGHWAEQSPWCWRCYCCAPQLGSRADDVIRVVTKTLPVEYVSTRFIVHPEKFARWCMEALKELAKACRKGFMAKMVQYKTSHPLHCFSTDTWKSTMACPNSSWPVTFSRVQCSYLDQICRLRPQSKVTPTVSVLAQVGKPGLGCLQNCTMKREGNTIKYGTFTWWMPNEDETAASRSRPLCSCPPRVGRA